MRLTAMPLLALCLVSLIGCTVNGRGLIIGSTMYLRNDDDSGRALVVDAWGIQLSTYRVDSGVNFGHMKRTYLFAGDASSTTRPSDPVTMQRSTLKPVAHEEGGAWKLREPIAAIGHIEGLALHAGAYQLGLSLGFRSGAIIALPKDGSRSLLLRASSTHPFDYVMSYHEGSDSP